MITSKIKALFTIHKHKKPTNVKLEERNQSVIRDYKRFLKGEITVKDIQEKHGITRQRVFAILSAYGFKTRKIEKKGEK